MFAFILRSFCVCLLLSSSFSLHAYFYPPSFTAFLVASYFYCLHPPYILNMLVFILPSFSTCWLFILPSFSAYLFISSLSSLQAWLLYPFLLYTLAFYLLLSLRACFYSPFLLLVLVFVLPSFPAFSLASYPLCLLPRFFYLCVFLPAFLAFSFHFLPPPIIFQFFRCLLEFFLPSLLDCILLFSLFAYYLPSFLPHHFPKLYYNYFSFSLFFFSRHLPDQLSLQTIRQIILH